ncbi:hypothetical protein ACFLVM_00720 [Chloroflexota bacterium]
MNMETNRKSIYLKIAILSLVILLLGSFWLSLNASSNPVSIVATPVVPREEEPILVTFKLNNPSSLELHTNYQFYVNGELLANGITTIPSASQETHQYAYEYSQQIGEQLNFLIKTQSELGNYENILSLPSYPPQVWSSFVSFASFSTSMMGFMSSMSYFDSTFGGNMGFNVGILVIIVLIGLLILMELTQPRLQRKTLSIMGRLRLKFSTVTWILFIIFIGMVYTKVVMIIAT